MFRFILKSLKSIMSCHQMNKYNTIGMILYIFFMIYCDLIVTQLNSRTQRTQRNTTQNFFFETGRSLKFVCFTTAT